MSDCPFCAIVANEAPATVVKDWHQVLAIVPLNPVAPGHVLVLPKRHVDDLAEDPLLTGMVVQHAAQLAQNMGDCNLIISKSEAATMTVPHLHAHLVPRVAGDGIALPWSGVTA